MSQEVIESLSLMNTNNDEQQNESTLFDKIIGHIEDLLMENEFQSLQQTFLEKYWSVFEPTEENKLVYMDIFQKYNKDIEKYINESLKKVVPNFSMDSFIDELLKRRAELDGEVFEVLLTFTDFLAFKELILDYRAVQEGKVQDLSSGLVIKSLTKKDSSIITTK